MIKKQFLLAAVLSFAFALTGCGGGGGGEVLQATSDTTVDINQDSGPATTAAVRGSGFNFPTGVPDFGTSGSTTVTFTAASGGSSSLSTGSNISGFSVTSGGQTATGNVNFGSCIFTVTNSTFPTGSPLAEGRDITINPCRLFINTLGIPADAQARPRIVRLILRLVTSANVTLQVSINAQGTVFINQIPVGSVPVAELTGS
ncbi:hypothetical protein [Ramlibacter sp. AN1133]|uniref:hypothetical protein n=1 Tax=Ramlibacter sp. AN1133 TaxID=3133429 RepID=UPI0030BD49B8